MSDGSSVSLKLSWTRLQPGTDVPHHFPGPRSSHGMSLLKLPCDNDNNNDNTKDASFVLIYGGEQEARKPLAREMACWTYDIQDNKWINIDCSNGPSPRVAHAQAVHLNKFLYVFGGRSSVEMDESPLDDLWVLDCSDGISKASWLLVCPDLDNGDAPPEARSYHRLICLKDSLYVFGGCGRGGRLSDLYKFDLKQRTWHKLLPSNLRGRGGANLLSLDSGNKLAVIAGFAGEETNDGQIYDIKSNIWLYDSEETLMKTQLELLRPRSVCISASLPELGVALLFGGEVNPSELGHEGAGGFANDVVVLDEKTGTLKETLEANEGSSWPVARGWADGCVDKDDVSTDDENNGQGTYKLYIYGGLTGDDENPKRLDDLWVCEISK